MNIVKNVKKSMHHAMDPEQLGMENFCKRHYELKRSSSEHRFRFFK